MTIEKIRDLLHAQPFRPFRIFMADGRHLDVLHPEFAALSPTGRMLCVVAANDNTRFIDTRLVTSLEAWEPANQPGM